MTLNQFVDKYLGKQVEYHSYSANAKFQCVDLANQYIVEVLGLTPVIGTNAKDFPTKISKQEFQVLVNTDTFIPKMGDICIWNGNVGGGAGHIAVVRDDRATTGTFYSFDQNWSKPLYCTLETHRYNNVTHFLRPISSNPGTMPENTDLNKVLTYYKVKTSDELIKMVDEQLGFLKSERESNQKLNSQIEGLKTTISEANKKFSTFVQNIVDKLNPIHPIMGMADETVCLGLIDEVVAQVSQLGSQLSKQEKIAQEKERELTDKNNELLRQIEQLQKEKNAIQSQVDKLQKGLDQVKQDQQAQKQEQADFESFNRLINTIKQFVKGLYGKK